MQYLVDTDWVIDYMHGVPRWVGQFDGMLSDGIGLSVVSLAELYDGMFGSRAPRRDEQQLESFLTFVEVVPLDDAICRIFARERGRLRAAGTSIGDFDLLISATAVRHGLTLLTNNRRHFERVRGLDILSA